MNEHSYIVPVNVQAASECQVSELYEVVLLAESDLRGAKVSLQRTLDRVPDQLEPWSKQRYRPGVQIFRSSQILLANVDPLLNL